MAEEHHHVPEIPERETRAADLFTRWVIVLIGAPAIIIATGYLVSMPFKLVLWAVHFDAGQHPLVSAGIRIVIVIFWVASSAWVIRLVWPKGGAPPSGAA